MYKSHNCLFLLEDSDSLSAYEKRAQTYPDSHTAAVAALDTIDHVHQVEALHRKSTITYPPAVLSGVTHTHVMNGFLYRLQRTENGTVRLSNPVCTEKKG